MGPSFLDALKLAADRATAAENEFRREIAGRTRALERERAFAFRRMNLMRAVADVIANADGEEIAVAGAAAVLRARLGWSSDSEARIAVVSHFAPVAQAMFATLAPSGDEDAPGPDVIAALAEFETWYAETHSSPFWMLFESYMPETPVVDF
ncbi:MAG: hypothetical protein ABSG76_11800 [Xanthobacteraceae bacterium]|jgi:hypothetical protein